MYPYRNCITVVVEQKQLIQDYEIFNCSPKKNNSGIIVLTCIKDGLFSDTFVLQNV